MALSLSLSLVAPSLAAWKPEIGDSRVREKRNVDPPWSARAKATAKRARSRDVLAGKYGIDLSLYRAHRSLASKLCDSTSGNPP